MDSVCHPMASRGIPKFSLKIMRHESAPLAHLKCWDNYDHPPCTIPEAITPMTLGGVSRKVRLVYGLPPANGAGGLQMLRVLSTLVSIPSDPARGFLEGFVGRSGLLRRRDPRAPVEDHLRENHAHATHTAAPCAPDPRPSPTKGEWWQVIEAAHYESKESDD